MPVEVALPSLVSALKKDRRAVLVAPPGSGKTTRVALELWRQRLVGDQEVVLLQPRRVAARAVASYMAELLGERVGETVGHQVRFDEVTSHRTRIRVVTEGILTARLQRDPELEGVGLVILDEFHERSLHADLALALVKEVQEGLRDDLMLLVMSATLAAEPVSAFLRCEVVRAEGRAYPVDVRFAGAGTDERSVVDDMVGAVAGLVKDGLDGDVLAFLHGVRPIESVRSRLDTMRLGVEVLPLHGSLSPREQDLALRSGVRPRVVLATNVAETSLTIPGVTAVVDSGLAKVMRYDLAVGQNRLETTRIARASADQRSGRAGRVRPGRALRLWTKTEDDRLRGFEDPEIRRVDLMRLVLELLSWGVDPRTFAFFERPDGRALDDAFFRLEAIGALERGGRGGLSALGRAALRVPVEPRLAVFLSRVRDGELGRAVRWAVALDQGLVEGDISAPMKVWPEAASRAERQLVGRRVPVLAEPLEVALVKSHADRVGVWREADRYALVGGRLGRLSQGHVSEVVVAFELEAGRRGEGAVSMIRSHAAVGREALSGGVRVEDELVWEADKRKVAAYRTEYWMDLPLSRKSIPNASAESRERSGAMLAEQARGALDQVFGGLDADGERLVARVVTFLRLFPDEVEGLEASREGVLRACLGAMCAGLTSFDELVRRPAVGLAESVRDILGFKISRRLDELLPERLEVPSGSQIKVEYTSDGRPPILAVKIQELFGLKETPRVAGGRLPVVLHLLSPAMRPLQVTTDLASFWSRTWPEVRAEMRTRYPKHIWPEDPTTAVATARSVQRRKPG